MIDKRTTHYKTSRIVMRDAYRVGLVLVFVGCMFGLTKPAVQIELNRGLVGEVKAHELPAKVIVQPLNNYGAPDYMVKYIQSLFGDDTQNMLTIIGTCENGTWDQTRTNTNRNGTKDWGIVQANDVNSKLCSGLDFKNDWKDNITCGHRIYKSQGLKAWACSHTVNVKSFWQ